MVKTKPEFEFKFIRNNGAITIIFLKRQKGNNFSWIEVLSNQYSKGILFEDGTISWNTEMYPLPLEEDLKFVFRLEKLLVFI